MVPRREQGTRDGGGDGNEKEGGINTRAGTRAKAGAGTKTVRRVEGRQSLGTFEVVIEVGRKMRERGRRKRVNSNCSRKTRRPSETVASYGGPEPRGGRRGTGSGRVKERRRRARNSRRVIDVMWETGETWAEGQKS